MARQTPRERFNANVNYDGPGGCWLPADIRHAPNLNNISQRDIAARFGVTPSQVSGIVSRRYWAHI